MEVLDAFSPEKLDQMAVERRTPERSAHRASGFATPQHVRAFFAVG